MATLELSFQNSSTLDAGLNTADSMSVSFSDTLNQIDSNFQEFDYGTPYVWNASNTRIDGSISSGGNFIITGSNLLGSVATINYLSYTDNYPAATLQLFGSVTSTDSWANGTLTKITYSTSNLSFELIGSIPINSYGTANSFTASKISYTYTSSGHTVTETFEGSLTFNNDSISGTVKSAFFSIDGQYVKLSGLNLSFSFFDTNISADYLFNTVLAGNDTITGTVANQFLYGYAGNDSLISGGVATTMSGGTGNDTYTVDDVSDVVTEAENEGIDTVLSSISYTLGANVENLTLTGTANLAGTGNELKNTIIGNTGNNAIDGGGDIDILKGGKGNDTYTVDIIQSGSGDTATAIMQDTVTELLGEGTDTIVLRGTVSGLTNATTLLVGANIENLDASATGTTKLNITGNALNNTLTGNDGNNVLNGGAGADTLIGGIGDDTYVIDNAADAITELSGEGTDTVQVAIATAGGTYTLGANLDNATLTNAVAYNLTGNALANTLTGNALANTLTGVGGNDTLIGGNGNDTYVVTAGDTVVENGLASDIDTVSADFSYSLGANLENLTLSGSANIDGTGNALKNTITGNIGNNAIDGGDGVDILKGGKGDDTYTVDLVKVGTGATATAALQDTVTELASEGNDTVVLRGSVNDLINPTTLTVGANIENLDASNTGSTKLNLTGSTVANTLTGNDADNLIDGGAGNDTLVGGKGNDTYVIDSLADTVTEVASEGTDTVRVAVTSIAGGNTYTLDDNVDNATLTNTIAFNLTGNDLDNTLTGNAAANTLTGGIGNDTLNGGAGADTLIGGIGDDTYVIDNAADAITELSGEGTDTVQVAIATAGGTYTLGANLDNATLTNAVAYNLTGNALANTLTGNALANTLTGVGGNDTLIGGNGNDTYVVTAGDTVVENGLASDIDTVSADFSYSLGANLENLTLSGSANIDGTGNALKNTITGNIGNNAIDGGDGVDILKGGKGDDTYTVDLVKVGTGATATAALQDTVTELASEGNDTVVLRGSVNDLINPTTLTVGANIENLDASNTGSTKLNLTGSTVANTLTGNDADNLIDGGAGNDTLVGGKGNDTYVIDSLADTVTEVASEGTDTVRVAVTSIAGGNTYTLDDNVDNATLTNTIAFNLTGNDLDNTLTGNAAANTLTGGIGNDTLNGGAGADTLIGGIGDDTYVIDNAADAITELSGEGTDTVQVAIATAGGTYTLGANLDNATLTNAVAYNLTGNALANTLTGNALANTLTGVGGNDTLIGGNGNDTYVVTAGDTVVENGLASDIDTVSADFSYSLGANLENLTLSGSANIDGTGNALKNTITGNIGNNAIDGGDGVDILKGGKGDDTYTVDLVKVGTGATATAALQDTVTELASEGNDTVVLRGSVNDLINPTTLTVGANIENLDASNTGSTKLNLTGSTVANTLTGNDADNLIDGGAGNDTLVGGKGNDTYVIDSLADTVTEVASEGTDTVRVAVTSIAGGNTYTLDDNVDNATLTNTIAFNLTGNDLDNTLTGNAAANTLTGGIGNDTLNGGAGADTLIGGIGDDTYVIDNAADAITELSGEGTDTVQVAIATAGGTYTLGANLDNATLTNAVAYNLTGNALANTLTGNALANTLTGVGGNDTLIGGNGNDTYVVTAGDTVVENGLASDIDTVSADFSYSLGANLENLTLSGSANIDGTGNALKNTITGNIGNNAIDGGDGVDILKGGKGDDTYTVDLVKVGTGATATAALQDTVTELASEGNDTVVLRGSVNDLINPTTLTVGANIENLDASNTGSTKLNLTGSTVANTLTGNDADNLIDGGAGNDTLVGGKGNDTYVIDSLADTVTEVASEGTDTVRVAVTSIAGGNTYTLDDNVDNATLTNTIAFNLTGNDLDNTLTGNAAANTLTGGIGNDTLNGGAGADTLIGGIGDDTYVIDNAADAITELSGEGTDTVQVAIATAGGTYTLGANLDNATLTNAVAYNLTGNALANTLTGNALANTLTGVGGNDTLIGGNGNDTYVVTAGDTVVENGLASDIDTVSADFSYSLGANLENLTLSGSANIDGTGNALKNTITGNIGNNAIDGGDGVDILKGGKGDDTYTVDLVKVGTGATATAALQDTVTELASEGNDTVVLRGSVNDLINPTTLTVGANIENLDASNTGSTKLNLTGSTVANTLTGNDADNLIDGGAGNDTLVGGKGNDTYVIDSLADTVTEVASEGTDTVRVAVTSIAGGNTYTLDDNVDNATLTNTIAFNLTGNDLDNTLTGNAAANTLTGGIGNDTLNGGAGADTLIGGIGDDTYVIDNAADAITELSGEGTDTVQVAIATAGGTYTLGANLDNATLTNAVAYNLTGNALANTLTGNALANTLTGVGGNDTLIGGNGNDTYVVTAGDTVVENGLASDIDTVSATV